MWAQAVNAIIGIWLMAAPQLLGHHHVPAINIHIAGPLITTFSVIALYQCTRKVGNINLFIGFWLILSPWLLNYSNEASIINDMISGFVVMVLAPIQRRQTRSFGGGWSALIRRNALHEQVAHKIRQEHPVPEV